MTTLQFFRSYDEGMAPADLSFVFCPRCGSRLDKKEIELIQRPFCPNCGYVQYINPLPGVAVLIEQDRKLLIGKRGPLSFERDKWGLPGGFIEHDETFIEAAHREVLEETGLKIEVQALLNVVSNHLSPSLHTLVPLLKATVVGGEPVPGDDLTELRWVSEKDTLPPMAFQADEYIIRQYFGDGLDELPIDERFRTPPVSQP